MFRGVAYATDSSERLERTHGTVAVEGRAKRLNNDTHIQHYIHSTLSEKKPRRNLYIDTNRHLYVLLGGEV